MDEAAVRWRNALLEVMESYRHWPLLLSGGADSNTLLAAQLELGGRPEYALTYGLWPWPELSKDWIRARVLTMEFGIPLIDVRVSSDPLDVERATRRVIRLVRSSRKTAVQCCHPLLLMLDAARQSRELDGFGPGDRRILTGTGGIVGDSRKVTVLCAQEGEDAAWEKRREDLLGFAPETATEKMKELAGKEGWAIREPYSEQPLADVGLSMEMAELNRPGPKGIAMRAFPRFYERVGRPLRPGGLQVYGGIRELHDQVFLPSTKHRRVSAVYARMLEEIEREEEGQQALL